MKNCINNILIVEQALRWWCNDFQKAKNGKESSFNIAYNQFLKEFMIQNPPYFKISNKCCHYAKKMTASRFKIKEKFDLNMYGVRKAEGGARRTAYKPAFQIMIAVAMIIDRFFGI